jgi:hypothetical protein
VIVVLGLDKTDVVEVDLIVSRGGSGVAQGSGGLVCGFKGGGVVEKVGARVRAEWDGGCKEVGKVGGRFYSRVC